MQRVGGKTTFLEDVATLICAFVVLNPSFKPPARPVARWLLKRLEGR